MFWSEISVSTLPLQIYLLWMNCNATVLTVVPRHPINREKYTHTLKVYILYTFATHLS